MLSNMEAQILRPPSDDMPRGELPTNHTPPQNNRSTVHPGGHEYNPMQSKEALQKAKISYQSRQWTLRKDRVNQALQPERNAVAAATGKQADSLHTVDGFSNPGSPKQTGITVRGEHRTGQKTAARLAPNGKRHNLITDRKTAMRPSKHMGPLRLQ